ncbi:RNA-guided pseudouridylation complex pseudouridine synthase subunit Cbf5 [Candidatus Woesearchaeota archaeon]|nr:RNA-guided pseudouridylation complex pseudouridine synthase subunit Cbf5 [Candidatus Woesearchaeota archaeon]
MKLPFEDINRPVLVKKESETSPRFGCNPDKRPIETYLQFGIVNIDKPKGPTSHQVSAYVQQMMGISKSGHSGTLDPNVTGVLPVALSKATKAVHALLVAGKEYVGIMHLHKDADEDLIRKTCSKFVGVIDQLPPVRSAVKRRPRKRTVYYLDVLEVDGRDVLFRTGTEAGTYIRKLLHDIGKRMKTGAHMTELRRTKVGLFNESTLVTLQDLQDAFWLWKNKKDDTLLRKAVQPMEAAVEHLPKIWIIDTTVDSMCHGAQLKVPGISKLNADIKSGNLVAVMTLKDELVALARARLDARDIKKKFKGAAAKTERVLMEPGVYPRVEK